MSFVVAAALTLAAFALSVDEAVPPIVRVWGIAALITAAMAILIIKPI